MKSKFMLQICIALLSCQSIFAQINDNESIDTTGMVAFFAKYTIDLDKVDNRALYEAIYKWKSTPYVLGGNSENGIDCSNLVKRIYEEAYHTNLAGNVGMLYPKCTSLPTKDMAAEGDLLFFKINNANISHVAIYLQHGMFAHATVSGGVMINNLDQAYYEKYFYQAARPMTEYLFTAND